MHLFVLQSCPKSPGGKAMIDPINDALFSLLACGSGYEEPGEPNIYEAKVKAALYHYHSIQFERDRLREENKVMANRYLGDLADTLMKLGKENDRLRLVLTQIANDGCGLPSKKGTCRDQHPDPDDRSEWCWCCIAREALEKKS
jgi:hypothetical protein